MKDVEIERKFEILDSSRFRVMIEINGGEFIRKSQQTDTYYDSLNHSFLAPEVVSEWLRIRSEQDRHTINFKRWLPLGVLEQTHCDEFETAIGNPETMHKVLDSLGFKEAVKVVKCREEWNFANKCLIAIDHIDILGSFVEFEYKGDASEVGTANEELTNFISKYSNLLGRRQRAGYAQQLLQKGL